MDENIIITAPKVVTVPDCNKMTVSMFLAGTIDCGDSEDWQKKVCDTVKSLRCRNARLVIFNPRRDEWPSVEGEIERQIIWELDHLEKADVVLMYLDKNSKSPISLMELGLYARSGKLIVFCSEDFYRWENVKIVCRKYGVPLVQTDTTDTIIKMIDDMKDYCSSATVISKVKNLT